MGFGLFFFLNSWGGRIPRRRYRSFGILLLWAPVSSWLVFCYFVVKIEVFFGNLRWNYLNLWCLWSVFGGFWSWNFVKGLLIFLFLVVLCWGMCGFVWFGWFLRCFEGGWNARSGRKNCFCCFRAFFLLILGGSVELVSLFINWLINWELHFN